MSTTLDSTGLDDAWRRRYLPPDLNARTVAICNENDDLKSEVQRLQAMVPDDAHARWCRTNKLETMIGNAAESIRARLLEQHQTFRISAVLDHLWLKRKFYGITKLPTRAVVQRVLVKHDLYTIAL